MIKWEDMLHQPTYPCCSEEMLRRKRRLTRKVRVVDVSIREPCQGSRELSDAPTSRVGTESHVASF